MNALKVFSTGEAVPGAPDAQQVKRLGQVIWGTVAAVGLMQGAVGLAQPQLFFRIAFNILFVLATGLIACAVSRSGRPKAASILFLAVLILLITLQSLNGGGIRSPGVGAFFILAMMAGLLLGWAGSLAVAGVCALISVGLVAYEMSAGLPPVAVPYSPLTLLFLKLMYLGVTLALVRAIVSDLALSLERAQKEVAERTLAEQRLELALNAGGIGVWEQDVGSQAFRGDSRAFEIIGLPEPADHVADFGQWLGLVDPEDRERAVAVLAELAKGSTQARIQYGLTRPDGSHRQILAAGHNVGAKAGGASHIVGVLMDVTEQARMQMDLSERVKELRLLHNATQLLQDRPLDQEGLRQLVATVPSAWKWPDVCVARIRYQDLEVASPGWWESPWRMSESFGIEGSQGTLEVAYLEARPTEDEGPFLKEERELIHSLAQFLTSSLTRERAERRRRELEAELRQAQKMEALGTLAGGVAHDFNNLLMAINGNAELLLAGLDPKSPAHGSAEDIAQAGKRASSLVRSILLYSRKQEPRKLPVALRGIVEEAMQVLRANKAFKVEPELLCAPDLPLVAADESQMHQIVMNLGVNAMHAMEGSGGTLVLELDTVVLDAPLPGTPALEPGRYVRFRVKDSGKGMPPEVMQRIFDPFFSTKGAKGTGLGLSVVYGIVRDHGGQITVSSEVGKGTTFSLLLPALEPAKKPAAPAPVPAGNGGGAKHVIFVDDEPGLLRLMVTLIQRSGHRCSGFDDPLNALAAFQATPQGYDALLTDSSMPGMTGIELVQAFRRVRGDLPAAIVSGLPDVEGMVAAGLTDVAVLQKPPATEDLEALLKQLLPAGGAAQG